ncbi:hypothetical protein RXV94_02525 [Yeosuana sp. MJ-SS3]|uniref:Carbohydrate-binding domain-containing protein n=1 Tax=Gilvirhabdus luticola TaxID=3079858 RepID=A0ABU3U3M5_9FLAO|nr:hypothetical protein [Yeosuana sp. MJ-SS3]MDU8885019.1 hypothetical protein [Yeosuana sp. MJ-SS3]
MKTKTFFYSFCLAIIMFACANEGLESEDIILEQNKEELSKGIANAPSESGIYIIRSNFGTGYVVLDFKTGLSATLGLDIEAACNGNPDWYEIEPVQFINTPNGRTLLIQQGDVYCVVLDGLPDANYNGCDFFLNAPVLAHGNAQLIYHDNDAWIADSNNKNTWSVKVNGRIEGTDGRTKSLSAGFQFLWDKNFPNPELKNSWVRLH